MARNITATKRGFGYDPALARLSVYADGSRKLDFGSTDMTTEAAVSAGMLFGLGTSTTPATTTTAGKFISFYFSGSGSTTEGLYIRTYSTGTSATGEAVRSFMTVNSTGVSDFSGIHSSLSFGTAAAVTGSAQAGKFTLQIPNRADLTGTNSAITCEIYSDGSSSDPASMSLSFIRFAVNGDTTGDDDVITDAFVFDWSNLGGSASGSLWYDNTSNAADEFIKVKTASGTRYLILSDSVTFS